MKWSLNLADVIVKLARWQPRHTERDLDIVHFKCFKHKKDCALSRPPAAKLDNSHI